MSNLTCLFVWCCTLSIEPIKVSSGKNGKVGHKNGSSSAKSVLLPEAAKHGPWFLESRVDGAHSQKTPWSATWPGRRVQDFVDANQNRSVTTIIITTTTTTTTTPASTYNGPCQQNPADQTNLQSYCASRATIRRSTRSCPWCIIFMFNCY